MRWILQLLGLWRGTKPEKPHISRERSIKFRHWPPREITHTFYWKCADSRGLGISEKGPQDAYREYIADIAQRERRKRIEKLERSRR